MHEDYQQLVEKVLAFSPSLDSDVCMFSNKHTAELMKCDVSVLQTIEGVINQKIIPSIEKHNMQYGLYNPYEPYRQGLPYFGTHDILGCYLVISASQFSSQAIRYIASLPTATVAEFIYAMALFYNPRIPNNEVSSIPIDYINFLKCQLRSNSIDISRIAKFTLRNIGINEV